jgi:hypothetical protein
MSKPGPICTVCKSKHRHQIELGLVAGVSHKILAARFGLGHDAVARHASNHLTAPMRAALLTAQAPTEIDLEQLRRSESEGLIAQLIAQRARLHTHGEIAPEMADVKACVSVESAITSVNRRPNLTPDRRPILTLLSDESGR